MVRRLTSALSHALARTDMALAARLDLGTLRKRSAATPARSACAAYAHPLTRGVYHGGPPPGDPLRVLHLYGRALRRSLAAPRLHAALMQHMPAGPPQMTPLDRFEWCLFLFAEKQWEGLADMSVRIEAVGDPDRRAALLDLMYLTAHRLRLRDRSEVAAALSARVKALRPTMPAAQRAVHEAFDDHLAGRQDAARRRLAQLAHRYTPYFALGAIKTLFTREALPPDAPAEPQLTLVRPSNRQGVVVVSLDKVYFERFFGLFRDHLKRSNPALGVHVHCIGFSPEALPDPSIGISCESLPFGTDSDETSARAYYASARFLHLPAFLDIYHTVHVSDVDGLIKDIPTMAADGSAVILRSKIAEGRSSRLPCETVSATNVSLRRSPEALRFADYLRRYLVHGFSLQLDPIWYIDQNALYCAWRDLKDEITITTGKPSVFRQGGRWRQSEGDAGKVRFMDPKRA